MRVSEILHTKGAEVVTLRPDALVRELVQVLRQRNLGAVVVSEDGSSVDGIVSERDVVRRLGEDPDVLQASVADLMTRPVQSCHAEDSVDSLMEVMTNQRIRHVPVVDAEARLAGIVSIGDVVKSRMGELQFERDQLQGYVSGR